MLVTTLESYVPPILLVATDDGISPDTKRVATGRVYGYYRQLWEVTS